MTRQIVEDAANKYPFHTYIMVLHALFLINMPRPLLNTYFMVCLLTVFKAYKLKNVWSTNSFLSKQVGLLTIIALYNSVLYENKQIDLCVSDKIIDFI